MPWWTRESSRQLLALPPALLGLLLPGHSLVTFLAVWDIYAVVYLLLAWLAYRGRGPGQVRAIASASRWPRVRWLTSGPEQLSRSAAALALVATLVAMPQADELDAPQALVLVICVVAVLTSWVVLQTGFTVLYLALYAEGGGLTFPGDDEPGMTDFVYFAVSVGTTFGATDVTVTQTRVRRHVLVHGVLAFLFNTLILAVAVTIATSYLAGS